MLMISQFSSALTVVNQFITERLDTAIRHYGRLPKMPERVMPEGDGVITVFENGQEVRVELRKMEASGSIKIEDFKNPAINLKSTGFFRKIIERPANVKYDIVSHDNPDGEWHEASYQRQPAAARYG